MRNEKPTYTVATGGVKLTLDTAGPTTVTGTMANTVLSSTIFTKTFAVPLVTPVTVPLRSTVATAVFEEDHRTVRDFGFRSRALIFAVCPSSSVSVAGVTRTAGGSGFVESQPIPTRTAVTSTALGHLTTRETFRASRIDDRGTSRTGPTRGGWDDRVAGTSSSAS